MRAIVTIDYKMEHAQELSEMLKRQHAIKELLEKISETDDLVETTQFALKERRSRKGTEGPWKNAVLRY
tara:strand:+ start:144 stop:350 length:207 start_codon:yes stop_codon:yes gene_type:complete